MSLHQMYRSPFPPQVSRPEVQPTTVDYIDEPKSARIAMQSHARTPRSESASTALELGGPWSNGGFGSANVPDASYQNARRRESTSSMFENAPVSRTQIAEPLPFAGLTRGATAATPRTAKSSTTASVMRSATASRAGRWIPSRSAALFLATVITEAVIVIVMVAIVFGMIQSRTETKVQDLKTVPVYLAIFLFGMIFHVAIVLDAFRLKNTIQVIGVAIFNVALTITAALEISQVREALAHQDEMGHGIPCPGDPQRLCRAIRTLFPSVEKLLIVVPVIVGVAQIPMTWLTYRIWSDFGWAVYQKIGADLRTRNMFLVYQVLVVLLKFDFFFGIGFSMPYLILVVNRSDVEYGITIGAIPAAIIVLALCAISARREIRTLMAACIVVFLAGIIYFIYKITRIYSPQTRSEYRSVRLTLTWFSLFATLSLFMTFVIACWCFTNFGKGLRQAHDAIRTYSGVRRNQTNQWVVRPRQSLDAIHSADDVGVAGGISRLPTAQEFDERTTDSHELANDPKATVRLSLD